MPKPWNLSDDQVFRADNLGLRVMLVVFCKGVIDASEDPAAAERELREAAQSLIGEIPSFQMVPSQRTEEFRRCAIDSAMRVIDLGKGVRKIPGPSSSSH